MIFITAQQNSVSSFSFHKIVYLKHIIDSTSSYTDSKIGKLYTKTTFHVQEIHILYTSSIIRLWIYIVSTHIC